MSMKRIFAFCFLLIAGVLGYLRIDSQPVWSPFKPPFDLAEQSSGEDQIKHKTPIAAPQADWLPDTGAPSVHAASLIALNNGSIRAFWFAGSREGAPDVVIASSVFHMKEGAWSTPTVVMDRVHAEKGLSRYIAKLGNPVPARMSDGRLQLFFVTVSIGGWAGSSISSVISNDEGVSWSKPERLITSPLINLSTLVKSPAIAFEDGRIGLPAYHEWIGRFGELLRTEGGRVIDKRRMSSGRGAIQPAILISDPQQAKAYFRQTRSSGQAKQIPVSQTQDAGQTWRVSGDLEIANPNSAIALIGLANGAHLMALNNMEQGRHRLVLMMNGGEGGDWQVIQTIEDDEALPNEQRREFSYPHLITANGSDAHLVYTWDRKRIRHIYFSSAWLDRERNKIAKVDDKTAGTGE
jgi:predicted neuraminidase